MFFLNAILRCYQHTDPAKLSSDNKKTNVEGVDHFIRQKCVVTGDGVCPVTFSVLFLVFSSAHYITKHFQVQAAEL